MADEGVIVKIKGIEETLKNLKRYQVIKTEATKIMLKEKGYNIERDAKKLASQKWTKGYWTGRAAGSISTNWSGSPMSRGKTGPKAEHDDGIGRPEGPPGLVVAVGTNVRKPPYPIYLEFGTRFMAAVPFLHPAFHMNIGDIELRLKAIFKK